MHEYREKLEKLKGTFEGCYKEYTRKILRAKKRDLFEDALMIVAVKDVFTDMYLWIEVSLMDIDIQTLVSREKITETELDFLLSLENPLEYISMAFWYHLLGDDRSSPFINEMRKGWGGVNVQP